MTNNILKTQNKEWGFWGTTNINYSEKTTEKRWNDAFEILMQLSGKSAEDIREFLDSREGRHLADSCINIKNIKQAILEQYFKWIDKTLFEDKKYRIKIEKDRTLFGTLILNQITKQEDVVLYTYKHPNRIYKNYAKCINNNEETYDIQMDYITTLE